MKGVAVLIVGTFFFFYQYKEFQVITTFFFKFPAFSSNFLESFAARSTGKMLEIHEVS